MFKKKETSVPAGGEKFSAELSDDQLDVVSGGVAGVNALDPLTGQDDPVPVADESLIDAEPPLNFTVPAETFTLFNDVVPIISSVPSPVFTVREVSVALLRDVVVPDGTS